MSPHDIALMRAIVMWRRANGVQQWKAPRAFGRFVQWTADGVNGKEVTVEFKATDDGMYAVVNAGKRKDLGGIEIDDDYTFVQAVDVLVALGYLPARFSSAYRAALSALYREAVGHSDKAAVNRATMAAGGYSNRLNA